MSFLCQSMKRTLSRYSKCLDSTETSIVENKAQKQNSMEVDVLREEVVRLQHKQLHLLGKDLNELGLKELQHLEQQIHEGLLSVKERKEQLLVDQLENSRLQEQRAMLENETLRQQVQELCGFFPSIDHPVPPYLEYYPVERKYSLANHGTRSPDLAGRCAMEKVDSDTTLHLGLPTDVYRKRKAPEKETHSNNSGSQMVLV